VIKIVRCSVNDADSPVQMLQPRNVKMERLKELKEFRNAGWLIRKDRLKVAWLIKGMYLSK